MTNEPPLNPTSLNPHRALMTIGLLVCGFVCFGLFVGWQWYFDNRAHRESILSYASKREEEARRQSDVARARELAEAAPPTGREDGLPSVSLSDMAKEGRKDDSSVASEPVTITLPLSPDAPEVRQADDVLQGYWKAKTWQERLPFVHEPERTRQLMEEFYEKQKGVDPVSGALLNRGRYRLDGTEILHFSYSCSRPGDVLELAMRRNKEGRFVLDWTSYVGFGEMAWSAFKQERTSSPKLFRAFAALSDYYNYEFDDQTKLLSVNLLSPDGLISLHGYCERSAPLGIALVRVLNRSNNLCGVVVKLAFPEKAQSDHCVWLKEFLSDRWLLLP